MSYSAVDGLWSVRLVAMSYSVVDGLWSVRLVAMSYSAVDGLWSVRVEMGGADGLAQGVDSPCVCAAASRR